MKIDFSIFRRASIRRKLMVVIILTSLFSVLLAVVGFVVYELVTFRQVLVNDLSTKAEIIAQNSTAALLFANKEDAEQTLNALQSEKHVRGGAIFDKQGAAFAGYQRDGVVFSPPASPGTDGSQFEADFVRLFQPIMFNGQRLGTIYLESDLEALNQQFQSYGRIALLVLTGSMIVAFLLASALQRGISKPILNLADAARRVSEQQDFSIRVVESSKDELGYLGKTFNKMLSQIQKTNEAMSQEIAERRKAEEVLRSSEERFRNLFQAHPLPMWVYDTKTLRFLEVNESTVEKYGYSREEFLEMRITEIRPPEDVAELMKELKANRGKLQSSGPWVHRLRDGRLIDVEIVSHTTDFAGKEAVLVVALDITERRKAERELKISEERYRLLVSGLTSIVWASDAGGAFAVPQKSWEKYTGQRWEEHAGPGWFEAFHPEDRDRLKSSWDQARENRSTFESEGMIWHAASNAYRYFVVRAMPLFGPDHSVREWIGTVTDVHDRKTAEEEIRKLNAVLEERVLQRTAALEEANKELEAFSYSVSHDLRAPLRHVDGFAELLIKKVSESTDEKVFRYAKIISESAKRMGQLVDELLVFSRMGRTDMRLHEVDMNIIVKDVVAEIQRETSQRTIDWHIMPLPRVKGDETMLRLVMQNLISNAVKYSGKRDAARVEIGCRESEAESVFYVQDNGAGFDMKYAEKLFGVFQRLHRSDEFEGIGIGLANVRRIIHRHGGKTWAEGKVDAGATFSFSLPRLSKGSQS